MKKKSDKEKIHKRLVQERENDEQNIQPKLRKESMINLMGDTKNKTILDLGGGTIKVSKNLNCKKIYILDIDDTNKGVDIICDLNKEKIPLPDNSIDIIIAGELIEHLNSPLSFLNECKRILKKKGIIILSTPNLNSLKNRFKVLFGQLPEYCCISREDGKDNFMNHIKDFNYKHLRQIIESSGLKIEEATTNGIIVHSHLIFPRNLTPTTLGEILIIKIIKED